MNKIFVTTLGFWAIEGFGETTCFLIEAGDQKILLDAAPGVCQQLYSVSVKPSEINTALISHVHGDHLLGLPYFTFARNVAARQSKTPVAPLVVAGNEDTVAGAKTLLRTCYPERDDLAANYKVLNPGENFQIGLVNIIAFEARHTVPVHAFKISYGTKSIGYTADTVPVGGLAAFFSDVDLLIVECFGLRNDFEAVAKKQMHLLADETGQIANASRAKKALLFHMHVPYQSSANQIALVTEIEKYYSGEVIFPNALQKIEI